MICNYDKAIELIKHSESIAVFMHVTPDGDCIGSALALCLFLKKCGKKAECFSPNCNSDNIPTKYKFLPGIDLINATQASREYDLCIAVDVADISRFGDMCFRMFMKGRENLIIDHHGDDKRFAQNVIVEENAASTTQILYKILVRYNSKLIDADIATCLYVGLATDSGSFSFQNTSTETHQIAAELIKFDMNTSDIVRKVMKDIDLNVFKLKSRVLNRAEFFDDGYIGLISFFREDFSETGTTDKDTEGIINSILDISGIEVAIAISEINDNAYKVSFRSKTKVNAAACARCFGGGGHFHASGCRAYGQFISVKEKLISVVREMVSYA